MRRLLERDGLTTMTWFLAVWVAATVGGWWGVLTLLVVFAILVRW